MSVNVIVVHNMRKVHCSINYVVQYSLLHRWSSQSEQPHFLYK